jgi:hypothetical protein
VIEKNFEHDDPYALVGQGFPCPAGFDSVGLMARSFVEEYAMIGFGPKHIMRLFKTPYYQGPHGVLAARGENYVQNLIQEVFAGIDDEVIAHG